MRLLLRLCRRAVLFPVLWILAAMAPVAADEGTMIAQAGIGQASVGYSLFDLTSGEILAERQPDAAFVPASVAKLPTVAAALALLGPGHRFVTTLHGTGPLRDGVLEGDLILRGGGDPSLTTADLVALAAQLRALGLTRIAGRFLFDATALPELPEIEAGQPWAAGYNTGVGALSVNYNRIQRRWARGPDGAVRTESWSMSDAGNHRLEDAVVDGPEPPSPAGPEGRAWLPVRHPGLVAATLFRQIVEEAGIALPVPAVGLVPPGAALLATHESAPLASLARDVLRYSNNLSAELIGLAAARRLDPELDLGTDTLARSAARLSGWLDEARGTAEGKGWSLANHSGLTTASRTTPHRMAALVRAGGPTLWNLLPGEDEGKAPSGVRAKSGTLAYAKALAGTLTAASGRRLGFALFIADEKARLAFDATMDRSRAELPPEARAWLAGARILQAQLLARWAEAY